MILGRFAIVVSSFVIAMAITGCSEDGAGPQGTLPPKTGSYWTFDRWSLDSNRQEQDKSLMTATVGETEASFGIESGLLRIDEVLDPNSFAIYLRYEPNGDLRVFHPFYYPRFITLPVGSKSDSVPLPLIDTSFTEQGTYYAQRMEGAAKYVGSEELEVAGRKLATEHVVLNVSSTGTVGSFTANLTGVMDFWYAPSIGYFAKIETWFDEDPLFGVSFDRGERRVLTTWSLKP